MSDCKTRTIVVTGAGGYIGRHVVNGLVERGVNVIAISRRESERGDSDRPLVQHVTADVLDEAFHLRADRRVDGLIHLAWQDGFAHNSRSHIENLSAHYAFLVRVAEAGIPRITALGSMHEVGYWEGSIDNETPTNPVTLYGVAKDALRRASFATLSDQVELAWVRAFYIVGDDRQNHSVFTKLLAAADEGQSHFALTSGTNRYDFINVEELGRQIATVALAIGEVGVINCCSGVPVSLRERIDQFICNHGLSITPKYGAFPDRPYDSPSVWGDPSNIKRIMASFQAVEKTENR